MQNALGELSEDGTAAWGKVKVTLDGNQKMINVAIEDDMLADKSKLEDAIKEAFNDASKKIQRKMAMKMKDMGGLDALKNLGL